MQDTAEKGRKRNPLGRGNFLSRTYCSEKELKKRLQEKEKIQKKKDPPQKEKEEETNSHPYDNRI